MAEGIRERHSSWCPTSTGERCRCQPAYEASVYSRLDRKKLRRTFTGKGAKTAARHWRGEALRQARAGTMRAPAATTVREALTAYLAGMDDGTIRTRNGDPYKPSAIRAYRQAVERRLMRPLGGRKLADLTRVELQDLVSRWQADGLDPSTIRNTLLPLRVTYRRAIARGIVGVSPTAGLELPAVRGRRDRVASPAEAAALIAALDNEHDAAVWATALYGGLRYGELRALRWDDIDLDAGLIRVRRSWDAQAGEVEPKSRAGRRTVPIAAVLRPRLLAQRLRSGRSEGLVFGPDGARPFQPESLRNRTRKAWASMNEQRAEQELDPIAPLTLHDCRHTCASLLIAAGANVKALSTIMGHSSIQTTFDLYGHMLPGAEHQVGALLDTFLAAAEGAS